MIGTPPATAWTVFIWDAEAASECSSWCFTEEDPQERKVSRGSATANGLRRVR